MQACETLNGVDKATETELKEAARAYVEAPKRLKAAILRAAFERGETPASIVRAIGHVYTYDYVARLIRQEKQRRAEQQT